MFRLYTLYINTRYIGYAMIRVPIQRGQQPCARFNSVYVVMCAPSSPSFFTIRNFLQQLFLKIILIVR